MSSDHNLLFLSGKFLNINLSKDKMYLFKYFKADAQKQFVVYYLEFGELTHFVDHTGYKITKRWLFKLQSKLLKLLEVHNKFKQEMDIENLALLKMGKYDLGN